MIIWSFLHYILISEIDFIWYISRIRHIIFYGNRRVFLNIACILSYVRIDIRNEAGWSRRVGNKI